jgi:hypothetical protein
MSSQAPTNNATSPLEVELQPRLEYGTLDLPFPACIETVTVSLKYSASLPPAVYHFPKKTHCAVSKFFRTAFENPIFIEAQSSVLHLRDAHARGNDIESFDLFADWVLGGAVVNDNETDWRCEYKHYIAWMGRHPPYNEDGTMESIRPAAVWNFDFAMMAYLLGDYLQCPSFQNHCLGMMYNMDKAFDEGLGYKPYWQWEFDTAAYFEADVVLSAWRVLLENDKHPIFDFLADWLACHWDSYEFPDHLLMEPWDDVFATIPKLRKQFLLKMNRNRDERQIKPLEAYYMPDLE